MKDFCRINFTRRKFSCLFSRDDFLVLFVSRNGFYCSNREKSEKASFYKEKEKNEERRNVFLSAKTKRDESLRDRFSENSFQSVQEQRVVEQFFVETKLFFLEESDLFDFLPNVEIVFHESREFREVSIFPLKIVVDQVEILEMIGIAARENVDQFEHDVDR